MIDWPRSLPTAALAFLAVIATAAGTFAGLPLVAVPPLPLAGLLIGGLTDGGWAASMVGALGGGLTVGTAWCVTQQKAAGDILLGGAIALVVAIVIVTPGFLLGRAVRTAGGGARVAADRPAPSPRFLAATGFLALAIAVGVILWLLLQLARGSGSY